MVSAIIVAGGSSQRMGFDKLEALLNGKELLRYSLEAFENCNLIDEIYLVCPPEKVEKLEGWRGKYGYRKLRGVAAGGAQRQESVMAGLGILSPHSSFVAIHDGARPLITPSAIYDGIEAAKQHQAATLARPVSETVKRSDNQEMVSEEVDREGLWIMETPQIFERTILEKACHYIRAEGLQVTDEVSALRAIGAPVKLVNNPQPNPKITFPSDLQLAEHLLKSPS